MAQQPHYLSLQPYVTCSSPNFTSMIDRLQGMDTFANVLNIVNATFSQLIQLDMSTHFRSLTTLSTHYEATRNSFPLQIATHITSQLDDLLNSLSFTTLFKFTRGADYPLSLLDTLHRIQQELQTLQNWFKISAHTSFPPLSLELLSIPTFVFHLNRQKQLLNQTKTNLIEIQTTFNSLILRLLSTRDEEIDVIRQLAITSLNDNQEDDSQEMYRTNSTTFNN
jgi:hypothetical protein